MSDMINPQKGIDLMNNISIIIRILIVVTLFQHAVGYWSWSVVRDFFLGALHLEKGALSLSLSKVTMLEGGCVIMVE